MHGAFSYYYDNQEEIQNDIVENEHTVCHTETGKTLEKSGLESGKGIERELLEG